MLLILLAVSKLAGSACPPFFRRFHRPAVDDPGGGAGLAPVAFAARCDRVGLIERRGPAYELASCHSRSGSKGISSSSTPLLFSSSASSSA